MYGVIIAIIALNVPLAYAVDYEYNFAYDDDNMYSELEAYYCASVFLGETYDNNDIDYTCYEDPTESYLKNTLIEESKLFYYSGHGGELFGLNFIAVPPGMFNSLYGSEIPDLTSVTGGGNQLLGYISTCYSGMSGYLGEQLCEAFDDEGADAYFGFKGSVTFGDKYYFSMAFFDSLADGNDVDTALDDALDDNGHDLDSGDVLLYGDSSTTVVD